MTFILNGLKNKTQMKNQNKPAFSVALKDNGNALHKDAMGLTKREYFAAMAMQGIIGKLNVHEYKDMAEYAVNAADALLAKLSNEDC